MICSIGLALDQLLSQSFDPLFLLHSLRSRVLVSYVSQIYICAGLFYRGSPSLLQTCFEHVPCFNFTCISLTPHGAFDHLYGKQRPMLFSS